MSAIQHELESAVAYHRMGQLQEAEAIYRRVVSHAPGDADALHFLGVLLVQKGDLRSGIDCMIRAIGINPRSADYHRNLGRAYAGCGLMLEAANALRTSAALQPGSSETWNMLGEAMHGLQQSEEAKRAFRSALQICPGDIRALNNLANVLRQCGELDSAIASYREALRTEPNHADILQNLGNVLREANRSDEAVPLFKRLVELQPGSTTAHGELGGVLRDTGAFDESIRSFRSAIEIEPANATAHAGLAMSLLSRGDLPEGFAEYEWRWQIPPLAPVKPVLAQPLWDGTPLAGKRILLHAEQGFGDSIQFARFIPLVGALGGRVIVAAPPELKRLLKSLSGIETIIARGEPIPSFEVHCPFMTLPLLLRTSIDSLPNNVPYLRAESSLAQNWRGRVLSAAAGRAAVGVAWTGNASYIYNRRRCTAQDQLLSPLLDCDRICGFSLQKSPAADAPHDSRLIDWTRDLHDFADTAAIIDALDLTITVDTAVAHLAGAMGKPVWVLLDAAPDWRWMRERSDSPWYPTMRIFRQRKGGDWKGLISHVAEELRNLHANRSGIGMS